MLQCSVCGEAYVHVGSGRLEMCLPCFERNFAGAQPPLDLHAPATREAMEDYAMALNNPQLALTPRQVQALARMHLYWQRRQAGEGEP